MSEEPRDFGQRPELTWLPVDRLEVDPTYQRSIEGVAGQRRVHRIAADFHWAAFQAILAAPIDGRGARWSIIDGQHRVAAAASLGIALVPAVVVHGVDRAGQSRAFVAANHGRSAVTSQELFHAALAGADAAASAVNAIAENAGIKILRYAASASQLPADQTPAARVLLTSLRVFGQERLALAVSTVADAFRGQRGALRGIVFVAACRHLAAGGTTETLHRGLDRLGVAGISAIAANLTTNSAIAPLTEALNEPAAPKRIPIANDPVAPLRAPVLTPTKPLAIAAPTAAERAAASAGRFPDDPRARADHGSREFLGRPEPFGRSGSGSSLA